jgi:hypothetical protein
MTRGTSFLPAPYGLLETLSALVVLPVGAARFVEIDAAQRVYGIVRIHGLDRGQLAPGGLVLANRLRFSHRCEHHPMLELNANRRIGCNFLQAPEPSSLRVCTTIRWLQQRRSRAARQAPPSSVLRKEQEQVVALAFVCAELVIDGCHVGPPWSEVVLGCLSSLRE